MAGLYFHIPFCKQACHYCNFHFSTSLRYKSEMVAALIRELELRLDYLPQRKLSSVYFGGGTPSLLTAAELAQIFTAIQKHFQIDADAEITLEANPDDLNASTLKELAASPINRLSIGIQSFSEADLRYMNRAHNAQEALQCIDMAQREGFEQLTVDLIYGAPTTSDEQWAENLARTLAFGIPHLSCYALTVEPNTALDHFIKKGKAAAVEEEKAARHFEYLVATTTGHGYQHYEISNFALPNRYARHNTSYWQGEAYLGIGPSAHSFDGKSRQWNRAHNAQYLKAIAADTLLFEREELTTAQRYNEYLLTGLRTMWGVQIDKIAAFGESYQQYFLQQSKTFIDQDQMLVESGQYRLSNAGKLLADRIAMELFWEED